MGSGAYFYANGQPAGPLTNTFGWYLVIGLRDSLNGGLAGYVTDSYQCNNRTEAENFFKSVHGYNNFKAIFVVPQTILIPPDVI